ncbi:MAG: TlyA family RNA methyltransferase [Syntrophomonadaceae bacterium]|nr:TlyA family RNA methyltransferase [Syntrophomonadaceae bacterium]
MAGTRADVMIYEKGLAPSREKARAFILAGQVFADGRRIEKPGQKIPDTAELYVEGQDGPHFVSRGGIKLMGAIEAFQVDFNDKVVLDVGASTGGFTDCALQQGAKRVYAVDVGYGQLDWKLRQDQRVTTLERTNIRHVNPEDLPEKMDLVLIDVAFISLKLVLPVISQLLNECGEVVALVKPQFEAGREQVGKRGVVRNAEIHREVLERLAVQAESLGLFPLSICFSPIKGPQGNIEYFLHLTKSALTEVSALDIADIVSKAHAELYDR